VAAVAERLQAAGFATLLFDLLSAAEQREDALTGALRFDIPLLAERLVGAIDWAARQPDLGALRVGLYGASTGAAAALVAAAARPQAVFAVVSRGGRKVTLVDYTLVPDIAVVDPNLTVSMPPALTADTGIDALTHALEAGVSIFATPYTDALCAQAARLIFDALPKAHADGSDLAARTAMANAATIAGLAFANAFVGVNHALAHAVGARFGLSHGRVNGIFLPHVMRYNASLPTKFMPAPGYGAYVAPEKYATLGWVVFGGRGPEEQRRRLFSHVDDLLRAVGIPRTLREAGVDEAEFEAAMPDLLRLSFEDPSIRTNPRMPLLTELESLLRAAYG